MRVLLVAWFAITFNMLTVASDRLAPVAQTSQSVACLTNSEGRSVSLTLEIADTAESRTTGLMQREHLAPDTGMLFIFTATRPGNAGFWMYNTLIPLDIAFLNAEGEILRILTMTPCPHGNPGRCPSYRPGVSYNSALETNAGFFAHHGLRHGDRVEVGSACHMEALSTHP